MKDLAVSIITMRDPKVSRACVEAFAKSAGSLSYDIFMFCNGVKEGSVDVPEGCTLIYDREPLYPSASRRTIEDLVSYKDYKYLLVLDDDVEVEGDAVARLFNFMESSENVNIGLCSGSVKNFGTDIWMYGRRGRIEEGFLYSERIQEAVGFEDTVSVIGGFYIMRHSLLRQSVKSDPNISFGYWDVDLPMSVKHAGYRAGIWPHARGIHRRLTANDPSNQYREMSWRNADNLKKSAVYFYRKWGVNPLLFYDGHVKKHFPELGIDSESLSVAINSWEAETKDQDGIENKSADKALSLPRELPIEKRKEANVKNDSGSQTFDASRPIRKRPLNRKVRSRARKVIKGRTNVRPAQEQSTKTGAPGPGKVIFAPASNASREEAKERELERLEQSVPGDILNGNIKVSFIVTFYNQSDNLVYLLDSLKRQNYKNFELVLCDDYSEPGQSEAAQRMLEEIEEFSCKYTNTLADGFNLVLARNQGAEIASGDIFVFADTDYLLNQHFMYGIALEYEDDAVLSTEQYYIPLENISKALEYADKGAMEHVMSISYRRRNKAKMMAERKVRACDIICGNCLCVPRHIFYAVGGYDEKFKEYGFGGADNELCNRLCNYTSKIKIVDMPRPFHLDHRIKKWEDELGGRQYWENVKYANGHVANEGGRLKRWKEMGLLEG